MSDETEKKPEPPWEEQLAEATRAAEAARARMPAAPPSTPALLSAPVPRATRDEDIETLGARLVAHAEKAEAVRIANLPRTVCIDCGDPLRGPTLCGRCRRHREEMEQEMARYDSIPEAFRELTFGSEALGARVRCAAAIESARRAIDAPWVILEGATGLGKTSLAAAMMRAWLATHRGPGENAYFAMGPRVATARAQHGFGRGEPEEVRRALGATLVVLDELPSEGPPSSFSTIHDIIYERHAARHQTFVTTWMNPKEAELRYGDGVKRRLFQTIGTGTVRINCATGEVRGG
jgi:DNA replication protein DnaC